MLSKTKKYIIQVMRGKRHGFFALLLKGFFRVLSLPYQLIVFCRNWAYDREWLRQYQPPVPVVISVGNIVVGGSGKTPVTLMLGNALYEEASIGILSRGYRSPAEKLAMPVILSSGKGPVHSAAYCGDEPYMLAENLPKACVIVGKDRHKSANMAAKAGVEIALLDDGMQHRRIGRDYEVVVMDVDDPFGQEHFLPRGLLRESPKSLSRADLIVLNHVNDPTIFEGAKLRVREYSSAPIVGTCLGTVQLYDLYSNEVNTLNEKKVGVFCGIAQPERFFETVRNLGAQAVGQEIFPDHHVYCPEQIAQLATKYKSLGAEMLVCTEKDKVKLPEMPENPLPVVWVKIHLQVTEGQEGWENFLDKVKLDLEKRTQKKPS